MDRMIEPAMWDARLRAPQLEASSMCAASLGPCREMRTLSKLRANELLHWALLFTRSDSTRPAATNTRRRKRITWPLLILVVVTILVGLQQPCACLYGGLAMHNHQFNMEPAANSIFGSLIGGSGSNNNEQATSQSAQQSADQQHQHYKNGQTSDKVTLPGDILLGGLFPIHMKGE